ncbi:NUDIX hydrolase [uncultured Photobacterium sp.]|uniref:NUDIX hydrolase n=1 Tax=uncultured Photobacterium sp. TaxID=173973 RepID=UPI00261C5F0A|nr:NUDIX hydrolase [uncultured Photobacterium sp.]
MNSKTLCQWKCFSVEQAQQTLPDGREVEFTTVKHPGAVVIIPVNQYGELVMVNQYRPAIKQWILEFPAGTLEDQENILECAKRELAEEVQLAATEWQSLGELLPVPGFCDEVQYIYHAQGLSDCHGELDEDEVIEITTLSVSEFEEKIATNQIQDAKTIATFFKAKMMKLI